MYTTRIFKPISIARYSWKMWLMLAIYSGVVVSLYLHFDLEYLKIPWVPMTLMGIAVAFYLGFKNSSAYDRAWEARKIWGAIVNDSRTWGIMVKDFVTDEYAETEVEEGELKKNHQQLMYRHIAWLYRLKRQLRVRKEWEHDRALNKRYRAYINGLFPSKEPGAELRDFLEEEEVKQVLGMKNTATQLIGNQSDQLRKLKRKGLIDDFRHMEMQKMLALFYTHQGKCERIKNYPLPRQYASTSMYFVIILIVLLPFGLLSTFTGFNDAMVYGTIPFTVLIGWVFWFMEKVGDYAENPFENLAFDTPMTSLTRTIEIDLREMLGETELPEPIGSKDGFVM